MTKCPKCHADNPETARFCGNCATLLPHPEEVDLPTVTLETPARALARGALFARRYEVIEELGEGGMGRIYRVLDKKINEEVALKLIRPEIAADRRTIDRFSNELKMARKISHKNICRMYHLAEEALDQLEYLISIAAGEIASVSLLRLDPAWDPLRDHPRFKQLLFFP